MTIQPPIDAPNPSSDLRAEVERLRLLHTIGQEFNSSLDLDELLPRVFHSVLTAVGGQGGSLWIAEGELLRCVLALGGASERLVGARMPIGTGFAGDVASKQKTTIVTRAMHDPRFQASVDSADGGEVSSVMATAMVARGVTVGSIQVTMKAGEGGVFTANDRALLEGLAVSAATAIRNAQLVESERRARDLAVLLEISREITSTLDLDRVLRSVVNLAGRALPFDRGAVGIIEKGQFDLRAVAGSETVNAKDTASRDLGARAEWAAGRGEPFYLTDSAAPGSDAERTFVSIFRDDLAAANARSGLYLPLKDEEGVLGILIFEAERPEFLTDAQRELAGILANQTAVALRNAQLYHQVPMVEALGTLAERRRALMRIPRRRRMLYAGAAVLALAALTLVRWPLRVAGVEPQFRPALRTDVRALVPGVIERVLVGEGTAVGRGAPIAMLRDPALRAERASVEADAVAAERAAERAASRRDIAGEQLQRSRARAFRTEAALLDEQIASLTVRAPVAGIVLTERPAELVGTHLDAGQVLVTLGRTDTLELEFGVDERDVPRVSPGNEIRLRVDALPQRTFTGRVLSVAPLPVVRGDEASYPVRAAVANPDSLLRPGMTAYARVLTEPASLAGRVLRGPTRWFRLLTWRALP
ncbi:MAG TPA: GAF domain-containing protein [Gemmatimonadales bacterium]